MIGNKHTDPVKVKLPSAKPLNKNQIEDFNKLLELNLEKIAEYNSTYGN
jgi:F0F1-type ATP synthase delta subunit